MKELTNQEIIQIANRVSKSFSDQSEQFEILEDYKTACEMKEREIGANTVINEILKAINAA